MEIGKIVVNHPPSGQSLPCTLVPQAVRVIPAMFTGWQEEYMGNHTLHVFNRTLASIYINAVLCLRCLAAPSPEQFPC